MSRAARVIKVADIKSQRREAGGGGGERERFGEGLFSAGKGTGLMVFMQNITGGGRGHYPPPPGHTRVGVTKHVQ